MEAEIASAQTTSGAATPDAEADGLPTPRRWWAMTAIALAIFMAVLDATIANVALPTISGDLRAGAAASVWVVNAYQIALVALLLPLAALGEVVGYRRVALSGLVVFTAASLACAAAPDLLRLSLARVIQGMGAAAVLSCNGAMVRFTYPHRMLGRAVAVNGVTVALSAALGPTIASGILALGSWRWLFAVNAPVGLLTFAIAAAALPRSPRADRRFDWGSAALNVAAAGLVIGGVQTLGRAPLAGVALLLTGLVAGAGLVRREAHLPAPIIPVDLLRIAAYRQAAVTSACAFAAQSLTLVALPFLLQGRQGRSAVATGLLITPWPLGVAATSTVVGRLADGAPAGRLCAAGLAVTAVGTALLARLPPHASAADIAWRLAVGGVGFGLFQTPNNRAMLAAAPRSRAGAAGGLLSTSRLVGQAAGAVGVALLFRRAGVGAAQAALAAATGVALIAAAVSLARTDARVRPASAGGSRTGR